MERRDFVKLLSALSVSSAIPGSFASTDASKLAFKVALSQFTFHRTILGVKQMDWGPFIDMLHKDPNATLQGAMDPRDIVVVARKLGVDMVDLANILFFGRANDDKWINTFTSMAKQEGVGFTCLMVDQLGDLGLSDPTARKKSIEQYKPWVETAAKIGCIQMRVNAYGDGSLLSQLENNAESMHYLADFCQQHNVELLVENHGFVSSNGAWLAMLVQKTQHDNFGVYTDLDNFFMGGWDLQPKRWYDRTQGLIELAPYTRGVSAKTHKFDNQGQETTIDYLHCMKILTDAGFDGYACGEYEGTQLSEMEGAKATLALLRNTLQQLASNTVAS